MHRLYCFGMAISIYFASSMNELSDFVMILRLCLMIARIFVVFFLLTYISRIGVFFLSLCFQSYALLVMCIVNAFILMMSSLW